MIQYSVIIPVYNGELTVEPLFIRLKSYFESCNLSYEVIFVYDCGKDNSWEVLMKMKSLFPNTIKLIKLSRNFGQHNALICGFEYAIGDFIITMDEDLQHAPEDILILITKQQEKDYDVVYGKYETRKHSGFRNLGSSLLKMIIDIGIPDIHRDYSAFRLIKSSITKATVEMRNSYTFLDGYLSWITTHCGSCIVSHNERQGGVSAYTLNKLVNHTINIFVTFSDLPIRFLSKFSITLLIGMIFFSIYIITRKLLYNDFAMGYPTLILAIGFGVGFIMLALGIIGEYIYRINLKTTKRPNYIIKVEL
jgi:undecaprenyl-phosphate 4-deoxy-4-formamido-L-arabinose transferase